MHHGSRATAPRGLEAPLHKEGKGRHAKSNRLFDTHPPIAERIAILRRLERLDPNDRGPVDQTSTGVPVDLAKLAASNELRTARGDGGTATPLPASTRATPATTPVGDTPTGHPPGWYPVDAQSLRYWDGNAWSEWTASWNGRRWVQN